MDRSTTIDIISKIMEEWNKNSSVKKTKFAGISIDIINDIFTYLTNYRNNQSEKELYIVASFYLNEVFDYDIANGEIQIQKICPFELTAWDAIFFIELLNSSRFTEFLEISYKFKIFNIFLKGCKFIAEYIQMKNMDNIEKEDFLEGLKKMKVKK